MRQRRTVFGMSLVFAAAFSRAPGITEREEARRRLLGTAACSQCAVSARLMRETRPEALIVVAAEHAPEFFMDNMPAYAIGMADHYDGPIEDPGWLGIARTRVPGNADLSRRIIGEVMNDVDVAFAEEWKFDHGIMVPLHFLTPRFDLPVIPANINCQGPPLTPLKRVGVGALRRACERAERIARSSAPAASRTGRRRPTREDQRGLGPRVPRPLGAQRPRALLDYSDAATYRVPARGGFEIRTFIAVAAAARGKGAVRHYAPIPIFSVGCTVATMAIE